MAKFNYTKAQAKAKKIVEKFGKPGQLVKKGAGGGYDVFGQPIAPIPDEAYDGTITPLLQYKQEQIDQENILMSDQFIFWDSSTAAEIGMFTTIDGDEYRIVNIKKLVGDGITVFQKLQLRR